MRKKISLLLSILSLLAFACAIYLFVQHTYAQAGLSSALFFILLAFRMLLSEKFKRYAYTVMILSAVSISLSFPEYFISIGDFQLSELIVPLLQIIMLGVGCSM